MTFSPFVPPPFSLVGNGGTAEGDSKVVNVALAATDFKGMVDFAVGNQVQLVVVGPEQPLVDGIHHVFKSG